MLVGYSSGMRKEDVLSYAKRDWNRLDRDKRAYWADQGATARLRASAELWRHMRIVRPGWPSQADCENDLAFHIELKERIDRASSTLRRH